jgi:hypothetical protein
MEEQAEIAGLAVLPLARSTFHEVQARRRER